MNTSYQEIILAKPEDLYEDIIEQYYNIPLDLNQLVTILNLLYENNEIKIHSEIIEYIQLEYSQKFPNSYIYGNIKK